MPNILVVEDDTSLRETLVYNLLRQEYNVQAVGDGLIALKTARDNHPDLVLLDLMLPGLDGFEVCRILRQEMNIPILILTARDDEIDRVIGLEIGADDYITKPFSMRELMARVKAHLRRERLIRQEVSSQQEATSQDVLTFGNLTLDLCRREVLVDNSHRHKTEGIRPAIIPGSTPPAGTFTPVPARTCVGVGIWRWHPYGGCACTLAARED